MGCRVDTTCCYCLLRSMSSKDLARLQQQHKTVEAVEKCRFVSRSWVCWIIFLSYLSYAKCAVPVPPSELKSLGACCNVSVLL